MAGNMDIFFFKLVLPGSFAPAEMCHLPEQLDALDLGCPRLSYYCIIFIITLGPILSRCFVHSWIALGRLHATILNQDFLDTPDFSILQGVHLG